MSNYDRRRTAAASKPTRPTGRDGSKAFEARYTNVEALLGDIKTEAAKMRKERAKVNSRNAQSWELVSDIGNVEELLWDALQFLRNYPEES